MRRDRRDERPSSAAPLAVAARLPASEAIETSVAALGYELVDVERLPRGLMRVTIDRVPGRAYAGGAGDAVTVDDCEAVTRQLQYALEVHGVAYERLEVSSPGLDRPLKRAADYERHVGAAVSLTLKEPFNGRKAYRGVLGRDGERWTLVFDEGKGAQALGFALDEVREARLVPVVDFKGRRTQQAGAAADAAAGPAPDGGQDR